MNTYKSFNQLNGKTLKEDDLVYFGTHKYRVHRLFLFYAGDHDNDYIFSLLGLDKDALAAHVYGKNNAKSGGFPETKTTNFDLLTAMTLILFAFYEKSDYVEVTVKGVRNPIVVDRNKFTRIKVMDHNKQLEIYRYLVFASPDGQYAIIGCQKIPFYKVEAVYKTLVNTQKK